LTLRDVRSNQQRLRRHQRCRKLAPNHHVSTAMSEPDTGFDYERYCKLLAEAVDEPKRLALINVLIEERAKDNLARQSLRHTLAVMGLTKPRADEPGVLKPLTTPAPSRVA
jgi:hypothetical protein